MQLRILICIPVYKFAEPLAVLLQELLEETPYSLLVIDDGSEVPLIDCLDRQIGNNPRIQFLRTPKNRGKGNALQIGFRWAIQKGFTHCLSMDGDGQHLVSEIPHLIQAALETPWSIIIGARDFALGGNNVPGASQFGRTFSNFWVRFQTGFDIQDSQSGFRLYPLFRIQTERYFCNRYDFEIEILVRALWQGVEVREVGVQVYYPPLEKRLSHFHKLKDNTRITMLNCILTPIGALYRVRHFLRQFIASTTPKKSSSPTPWTGRSRGGKFGNAFLMTVIRRLGLKAGYLFLYGITPYFLLAAPRATAASLQYWKQFYGARGGKLRIFQVLKQYQALGKVLMDGVHQSVHEGKAFQATSEGFEAIQKNLDSRGAILLSVHWGAWNLAYHYIARPGVQASIKTVGFEAYQNERQHERSPIPSGFHSPKIISNAASMPIFDIQSALQEKSLLGLMADRPTGKNLELVLFLGMLTAWDTTAFRIARATQTPVFLTLGHRKSYGNYGFHAWLLFDPMEEPELTALEFAKRISEKAEREINKAPEQWFNFYALWKQLPHAKLKQAGYLRTSIANERSPHGVETSPTPPYLESRTRLGSAPQIPHH